MIETGFSGAGVGVMGGFDDDDGFPVQSTYRPKKRSGPPAWLIIAVMLGIIGYFGYVVINGFQKISDHKLAAGEHAKKMRAEVEAVDAEIWLSMFEENGVSADEKTNGKWMGVSGIVRSIDTGLLGERYVCVVGRNSTPYQINSVQCFFDEANIGQITGLRKGDFVTITGIGGGTALLNVIVNQCEVRK